MNAFEAVDTAVFRKDYEALYELLKSTDVDPRDRDGRTPLMYAIVAEHVGPKMIEFLVDHGADVNVVENTERWTAAREIQIAQQRRALLADFHARGGSTLLETNAGHAAVQKFLIPSNEFTEEEIARLRTAFLEATFSQETTAGH